MQKANGIESHFSGLMQKLQDEFQAAFTSLEEFSKETESSIGQSTETFNERIEQVLQTVEKDINEIFAAARDTNLETLKQKFEGTRSQVETLSGDTAKQLKEEVKELTSKLTQSSLQSSHNLRKKCDEVKDKVQADMNAFVGRMTEHVTESETTRLKLAEAKARVIAEIRADLVSIRENFEENLRTMMKKGESEIVRVQEEVIEDMKSAYSRSLLKIGSDSQATKNEIEEAASRLLDLIEKSKTQALAEISRAAGQ